jgi:chromosome segregation ATPase
VNPGEIVGLVAGSSVLTGYLTVMVTTRANRQKVAAEADNLEADAASSLVDTATRLLTPYREELAVLRAEVDQLRIEAAANRETVAAQQITIAEQQKTIAIHVTSLAETRTQITLLERAFLALQDWIRDHDGDPAQILAAAGHPPGPAGFPTI